MKYSKITISGKICTGKSSLFRELLEKLNWPTFSTGAYFREYAKKHNLVLNDAEEQTKNLTLKVDSMVKEMLKKEGNLLVDAWLGGILAGSTPGVLRILLTAKNEQRFKRFASRENVSLSEAKREVLSRDKNWFDKVKIIHRRDDFFDKKNYNLVIDTSLLTTEQIVKKVLDVLK